MRRRPGGELRDRLRQRDPGFRLVRRAARLTVVASLVFYGCRYGLGNVTLATYALFGTVATGSFAQLPGPAAVRARTLLAAVPVAWALVAVGTVLAVSTAAASAGMLVIGFAVAFAGVGGPRLVGLANALQLFYILACFPPYQPETLPARLGGVTLGVALVALAEVTLWPDPAPVSFARRLAAAAAGLADLVDALADVLVARPGAAEDAAHRHDRAAQLLDEVRMARLPVTARPISAGRRDRAWRDAAGAAQEVLAVAESLASRPDVTGSGDADLAAALRRSAASLRRSAEVAVRRPGTPAGDGPEPVRPLPPSWRAADPARLRVEAAVRALADQVWTHATAVGIATGPRGRRAARPPEAGADRFWYAGRSAWSLYRQQFRAHLTPRSVYLEGAVRLAVALAAARVIAGVVNLQHGFWVLLATLSLMRASASDTRTTLRPALVGTLAGGAAGGLLLLVSPERQAYAALLPLALVLAFGVGPLLGLGWAQALLTLLLIVVFAQLNPSSWQLAGARVVDVAIGAVVGVLAGLLLWPRGSGSDLRRNAGAYLAASGRAAERIVEALAGRADARPAVAAARRAEALATSSFVQYHAERDDPRLSHVEWDRVLAAGHRAGYGGQALLADRRPGALAPWPGPAAALVARATRLSDGYADVGRQVTRGRVDRAPPPAEPDGDIARQVHAMVRDGEDRPEVLSLVEVDGWLTDLDRHLRGVSGSGPPR
ncbi:FUSC family protein [Micromonospora terminaliae]|uniref:FUSC family protein n=1 Tax=Micromonospora terminaliae TaxID=1914461 RepID=A0AAJ3DI85_9ACTN|nr:FUSC family protein [Micromonospora terminaliae]NES27452.1 FUSC family protein [Micromonospora terminaliae]QGL47807.1 FUSC family protein [Micromonospora terminaliae]